MAETKPAGKHKRTRSDHASELSEDYVEAIAGVLAEKGVCRAKDLVVHFGVTYATVNNTIQRLQRDGLVNTAPYHPIELTSRGRKIANQSRQRHEIVYQFLKKLGVSDRHAAIDAEGIEHHASEQTLRAMKKALKEGWSNIPTD